MPGVSQNTLGNPGSLERLAERFKLLLTRMRIGAQMLMIENLFLDTLSSQRFDLVAIKEATDGGVIIYGSQIHGSNPPRHRKWR